MRLSKVLNVTARQQLVFFKLLKEEFIQRKLNEIDSVSKLCKEEQLARNLLGLRDTENIVLVFVNNMNLEHL